MAHGADHDDYDTRLLSDAVRAWFDYYELGPDERAMERLCSAAIGLYDDGCRSLDHLATTLIGTYVGLWDTRVNSPSSPMMQ